MGSTLHEDFMYQSPGGFAHFFLLLLGRAANLSASALQGKFWPCPLSPRVGRHFDVGEDILYRRTSGF